MNFSAIRKADIANGPGFRVTIWCCGCKRHCKDCFNEEAQDPDFGKLFDDEAKEKIFRELGQPTCDGISFLGGEPLSTCSDNRSQTIQLAKECRERFPDKNQWLWTGYTYEEILADPTMTPILDFVDVIIDGPFLIEKKDASCPYRGSTNQRIIDVKKSREKGRIVEIRKFD